MNETTHKPFDKSFCIRITIFIAIGYLLATIPPIVVDHRLVGDLYFNEKRYYPLAKELVGPIWLLLTATTYFVSTKTNKEWSIVKLQLPFLVLIFISLFLYKPEFPHGNVVFVGAVWTVITSMTSWIHKTEIIKSHKHDIPNESIIAFKKEQSLLWRSAALGLLASYLVLVTKFISEADFYNSHVISHNQKDIFLLDSYSQLQVIIISIYMLFGPMYELGLKIIDANNAFLAYQTIGDE